MLKKRIGIGAALLAGIASVLVAPSAEAGTAAKIHVPSDFASALSDTRATGHYEVTSTGGLHIWTEGATSTDKVAEYVATDKALADFVTQDPTLAYTNTSGSGVPGFQLRVDFDGNGKTVAYLVGEPASYGNDWWTPDSVKAPAAQALKDNAPSTTGGSGSDLHGTLADWSANFPNARVVAFGFSLGSGVKGDGILDAITFAGTSYTFAADVILHSKDNCKNGGWATSTLPTYRNQGECVSHFASAKSMQPRAE